MKEEKEIVRQKVKEERESLLERLENWLEMPLLILVSSGSRCSFMNSSGICRPRSNFREQSSE